MRYTRLMKNFRVIEVEHGEYFSIHTSIKTSFSELDEWCVRFDSLQ